MQAALEFVGSRYLTQRSIRSLRGPGDTQDFIVAMYNKHDMYQRPVLLHAHAYRDSNAWGVIKTALEPPMAEGCFRLIGVQPDLEGSFDMLVMDFTLANLPEESEEFEASRKRFDIMKEFGGDNFVDAYTKGVCVGCGLDKTETTLQTCKRCGFARFCVGCRAATERSHKKLCKALRKIK